MTGPRRQAVLILSSFGNQLLLIVPWQPPSLCRCYFICLPVVLRCGEGHLNLESHRNCPPQQVELAHDSHAFNWG